MQTYGVPVSYQPVKAENLCNEYYQNEIAAQKNWGDRNVSIAATIYGFTTSKSGRPIIKLRVGNARIDAFVEKGFSVDSYRRNDYITVNGRIYKAEVDNESGDVNCVIMLYSATV